MATDRLFAGLLFLEWVFGVVLAHWATPHTWLGHTTEPTSYVWQALVVGAAIAAPSIAQTLLRPGERTTRYGVAISQALMSAHFIHLTGGRIETHFHIFASVAFLSFYRDWRVLVISSIAIALDNYVRGTLFPLSVFGIDHVETWRWLEHSAWVLVTVVVLATAGRHSLREMRLTAAREATIRVERDDFERRVVERTAHLAASEERFRCLSAASPIGVFRLNSEGHYLYVNEMWQRMFRRTSEQAAHVHWTALLHPDDRARARQLWSVAAADQSDLPEIVCRSTAPDEPERWVAIRATALHLPGTRGVELVGIAADVTDAKRSAMALLSAKTAAEETCSIKSAFLAHMSHEIRTPLNAIIGLTDLTLDTALSTEQRNSLVCVKTSADSLLTLVDDVLDFSRLKAGQLALRSEPFTLREVAAHALTPLTLRAAQRGLALSYHVADDVPARLEGDVRRWRQVLGNVVGNAIKFTDSGRIDVAIRSTTRDDASVMLECLVADTGIGIPSDRQTQIFAPFERVDGSLTRRHDGVGLGLAISARFVELMGGTLGVESTLGCGSTFRFTGRMSPIAPPIAALTPPSAACSSLPQSLAVLVAEDNEVNRTIAMRMLAKLGHRGVAVQNGREALDAIERHSFDAVLMDVQMPELDGLEATRAVRERERARGGHLPIVAVTAHSLPHDRELCLAAGMDAYTTKPLRIPALKDALERALRAGAALDTRVPTDTRDESVA